MQLIEIFKAGKRTDANGLEVEITTEDLQQAVNAYNVNFHESPAVIGHPKHNAPAYGWVKRLELDGDVLKAEFDQVDPEFAEMVDKGRFKKSLIIILFSRQPKQPLPWQFVFAPCWIFRCDAASGKRPTQPGIC